MRCWIALLSCQLLILYACEMQNRMFLGSFYASLPFVTTLPYAHAPQVRLVEGADPRVGGGGGLGPMLMGSRAACAMPYDMVGIADSVERMIAMMQRQGAGGHGDTGEGSEGGEESEQEGEQEGEQGKGNSGARLPFGSRGAGTAVGGVVGGVGSGGEGEGGVEGEGVAWGVGVDGEGEEAAVAGTVAEVQMLLGMGEAVGTFEL